MAFYCICHMISTLKTHQIWYVTLKHVYYSQVTFFKVNSFQSKTIHHIYLHSAKNQVTKQKKIRTKTRFCYLRVRIIAKSQRTKNNGTLSAIRSRSRNLRSRFIHNFIGRHRKRVYCWWLTVSPRIISFPQLPYHFKSTWRDWANQL